MAQPSGTIKPRTCSSSTVSHLLRFIVCISYSFVQATCFITTSVSQFPMSSTVAKIWLLRIYDLSPPHLYFTPWIVLGITCPKGLFEANKTLQLTLIFFPEVTAACLEFLIFPAMFPLHLPLGQKKFTTSSRVTLLPFVIHQARRSYWNVAAMLPVAWMRPAGTFLGLQ